MKAATTRSIVAAAGLAAIGLVAWPHQATPLAQQGVPTVHRDVALVDDTAILGPETTFDTTFFNDVLGPSGAEAELYNSLASSVGASEATSLLDATGASPIYSGDFNGAESRAFEGLFIDTLYTEYQLNQALGVSESASQTAILADLVDNPGPPIPGSADVTLADLTGAVGTSSFDTDLMSIANADYSFAVGDFEGYLTSLATDTSGLGDLSTVLTDLGSSFDDLSNLSGDLSSILGGLTGLL